MYHCSYSYESRYIEDKIKHYYIINFNKNNSLLTESYVNKLFNNNRLYIYGIPFLVDSLPYNKEKINYKIHNIVCTNNNIKDILPDCIYKNIDKYFYKLDDTKTVRANFWGDSSSLVNSTFIEKHDILIVGSENIIKDIVIRNKFNEEMIKYYKQVKNELFPVTYII